MPVATLMIVPTSRGVQLRRECFAHWLIPANARSKTLCKLQA